MHTPTHAIKKKTKKQKKKTLHKKRAGVVAQV
jgi:hypothetical protein